MEQVNRIKKAREEKGLSLSELATLIGKGRSSVFRYEAGQVPIDVVHDLATVLEVSPAYLLGWSDSKILDVIAVPLIDKVVNGQFISKESIEIPVKSIVTSNLSFYKVEDTAMRPHIIEDALVLAKDETNAEDGSLVVILPDGETTPLVRIIKYEGDNVLFIAGNRYSKIYTIADAAVLGDVVSITYTYNNI